MATAIKDKLKKKAQATMQTAKNAADNKGQNAGAKEQEKREKHTPVRNVKAGIKNQAQTVSQTAKETGKTPKNKPAVKNTVKNVAKKAESTKKVQQYKQDEKTAQRFFDQDRFARDLVAHQNVRAQNFAKSGAVIGKKTKNPTFDQMVADETLKLKLEGKHPDKATYGEVIKSMTLDPLSALKADAMSHANYGRGVGVKSKEKELSDAEVVKSAVDRLREATRKKGAKQQQITRQESWLPKQYRDEIRLAKEDYDAAKRKGDTKGMEEAHQRAETWRRIAGGFSGGEAGNEYNRPEISQEDIQNLNKEGITRLASAKLGWENATTDEERAKYARMGQDIRKDPAMQKGEHDRGAYRNEAGEGRMMYGGTEEERQREKEQLEAIPLAGLTGIAGAFGSIPGTTYRAMQTDAARNQDYLQNLSDIRGGGEINISEPEQRRTAQEILGDLYRNDYYQNASPLLKTKKLARAMKEIRDEIPASQRLLNKSKQYQAKATEGQEGLDRYLTEAIINGEKMVPSILASIFTGGAALPSLATMFAQTAGEEMGTQELQGKDASESWNRSIVKGATETIPEALPWFNMLRIAKGTGGPFTRALGKQIAENVASDEASEFLGYQADKRIFKDEDASLTPEDLKDTAAVSALMAVLMGTGAGVIGNGRTGSRTQTPQQRQQQQRATAIMDQTVPAETVLAEQEQAIRQRMDVLKVKEQEALTMLTRNSDDPMFFKHFQDRLNTLRQEHGQLQNELIGLEMQKHQRAQVEQEKARQAEETARINQAVDEAMQEVTRRNVSTLQSAAQTAPLNKGSQEAVEAPKEAAGLPVANPAAEQAPEAVQPQEAVQEQETPRAASVQYGQPENHIDNRQSEDLGNRNVKAFQWDHPEVKPFYQRAAEALKADAEYSDATKQNVRGSQKDKALGRQLGTVMQRNDALRMLHGMGLSTTDIIKACDAIINDQGQENYAAAKRVELALDQMLSKGYDPLEGGGHPDFHVDPDEEYLRIKGEISGGTTPGSFEAYLQDNALALELGEVTEDELRREWEEGQKNTPQEAEKASKAEYMMRETPLPSMKNDVGEENSRLSESDLADYMKVGEREHIRNAKEDIISSGQSPILTTMNQIREFMKSAFSGKSRDTIKGYGRVGRRLASAIAEKAGFNIGDLTGYYLELDGNRLEHMTKHIDDDGDPRNTPLSDEQMLRIPDYVDAFDDVLEVTRRKDGSVRVQIGKKINGHAIVLELISKGRRSLQPVTAWENTTEHYLKKYGEGKKNTDDTTSQVRTSNGQDSGYKSSVSADSIYQSPEESNRNLTGPETNLSRFQTKEEEAAYLRGKLEALFARRDQAVTPEERAQWNREHDEIDAEIRDAAERWSVGAAPAGFDVIGQLVEKYGAIEPGEEPVSTSRIVEVPKSISGEDRVSKAARTILEAQLTSDETARQIEKDIIRGMYSHNVKGLDETIDRAYKLMDERGLEAGLDRWDDVVNGRAKATEDDIALGVALWANAERAGNHEMAAKLAAEIAAEGTTAGRMVNAYRLLKRATPEGKVYYARKMYDKVQDDLNKKYGKKAPKLEVNEDLLDNYKNAKTEKEKFDALDAIYEDIAKQMPRRVGDIVNAWRYLAMLGNPRTHIRNVVGNVLFGELERTSGKVSAIMQKSLPKEQRTRSLVASRAAKDLAAQDVAEMENMLRGDKYDSDLQGVQRKVQERALGALSFLSKGNSRLLSWEDFRAKRRVYIRSMAGYITAKGWDPDNLTAAQLEQARGHAYHDAQVATFQEENAAAKAISRLEQTNSATKVLVGGVMPFKGVPLNIAKQGAIYSPFNAGKAAVDLAKMKADVYKGKKTPAEAIDSLAKGMTGSSILALGALLAAKGILTAGGSDDEDMEALESAQGSQEYALNIGGHSYTLDWAAPSVLPLFMGAEAYNIGKELLTQKNEETGEEGEELDTVDKTVNLMNAALSSAMRFYEPMLNMTVLSGVSSAIKSAAYADDPLTGVGMNMMQNYLGQFIPTALGQVNRTFFDDTRRSTFVDKNSPLDASWQRFIQRQENKIPGLSQNNIPYLDVWGRESKQDNVLWRAIENFASPGYLKKVEDSGVADELARLNDEGFEDVLPTKPKASAKVDGKYLTQAEYEARARTQGKTALDMLMEAVKGDGYQAMSDDEKAAYVKSIFDYAKEKGKEAAGGTPTKKVAALDQAAADSGIGVSALLRASMQIEATGDADGNGSIKTEEAWNAIQSMGGSDTEKRALFDLYNGTKQSYDEYAETAKKNQEKAEKEAAANTKAQETLGSSATVDADTFQAEIESVGGYNSLTYTDFFDTMDRLGIPESERASYYEVVQSHKGHPWKKTYAQAKKAKGR